MCVHVCIYLYQRFTWNSTLRKSKVTASGSISSWQIERGHVEVITDFSFLDSKITADSDCSLELKNAPWKESCENPRQHFRKPRHRFADKGPYSQSYGFSSSHVQMWELDHKEGWRPKNWCFQIVRLEKTFESPSDCKEIKPVNFKGNQPWLLIERTDAEAATPILSGHLMWGVYSLEKTLMLG